MKVENGDYIVAIDLGTNTVVAMIGTKGEDGRIRVIDREVSAVQGAGMIRGEIKNIDLVSRSIKEAVDAIGERQGIRITEAYAGISGQHIRSVKQPYYVFASRGGEIRQEDVRQLHDSMRNVPAPEGEKILQIIPQNYIVDDEEETANPVGTFGNKLASTFNIILGDSVAINRLEMALKRVDIVPLGLFLNAIASAEAVLTPDEKEEGVAVVDIGAGTTDVVVYQKNIIRHVGIIPMGGNVINKDIRSYGILEKHVENLKTRYGEAMRDAAQPDKYITTPGLSAKASKEISSQNLAAIIEARMLDIIDFVVEELKKSGFQDRLAAGGVLTGGGAQLKHVETLFKGYTGMDARVAGAESTLDGESLETAGQPAMATAVGILARAFDERAQNKTSRSKQQVVRPAREEKPVTEPASPVKRKLNDFYRSGSRPHEEEGAGLQDDAYEPEYKPKRKPGLFSKLREKVINMFDEEIEDNEI